MEAHVNEKLQPGTVTRLNPDAGFGYVSDAGLQHAYIFVFGKALSYREARELAVGKQVNFRVSGQGRVDELSLA
jgi:cold shock CspA family protein